MFVSQQFCNFISEQLRPAVMLSCVVCSAGTYINGYFCALISEGHETLYFKVDSNSRGDRTVDI